MTSNTAVLTEVERMFALDALRSFAKLLKYQDISLLPEVFVQNIFGGESVVVVSGGSDLESGTAEEHLAAGRELLKKLGDEPDVVRYAALAYDANLTSGDKMISVIAVEMLSLGVTHIFIQQYNIRTDGKVDLIGEPLYLGTPRSGSSASQEDTTTGQRYH